MASAEPVFFWLPKFQSPICVDINELDQIPFIVFDYQEQKSGV